LEPDLKMTPRAQFMAKALVEFERLPVGWTGLSEVWWASWNLEPPSPHCWGGLVAYLKKTGRLVCTGERRRMNKKASHNRMSDVLMKVR
jgi:hypothetical protein